MKCFAIVSLFILLFCSRANAQLDIGAGANFSFPLTYNNKVGDYHHAEGSPGALVSIRYQPATGSFVPEVTIGISQWILPVVSFGYDHTLSMVFSSLNFTVKGLYKWTNGNKEYYFGPGIGITYLGGLGSHVNRSDETISQVISDSSGIKRLTPHVMLSGEYVYPISKNRPWFLGIGLYVQYIYFVNDDTRYSVEVLDKQGQYYKLEPGLTGSMINPGARLSLYYRFGQQPAY